MFKMCNNKKCISFKLKAYRLGIYVEVARLHARAILAFCVSSLCMHSGLSMISATLFTHT